MTPRWTDLADKFEVDGSVLLLWVVGPIDMSVWQNALDLIGSGKPQGEYREFGTLGPASEVPSAAEVFRRRESLERPHLQAFSGWLSPAIRCWMHFSEFDPMWLSLAQQDVQSQDQLDDLCAAVAALGRRLQRDLRLSNEQAPQGTGTFIAYDSARDEIA